jgi:hypothetical protein
MVICGLLIPVFSQAQIVLNELEARNLGTIKDEDGDASDWIEIYNAGATAVNLQGYSLGDKSSGKGQWIFPYYIMKPGQRLLIFASGKNRKPSLIDHWETPVWAYDTWKYALGNANPGATWNQPTFNDAAWAAGKAGIGYGDADDSTIINNTLSVFMRQKFNIKDTILVARMLLSMDYDDAFIAYLNGEEIARNNISGTPPAYNAVAASGHEALMYQGQNPEMYIVADTTFRRLLRKNDNVLAVEVHNADITSTDLSAIPFLSIGVGDSSQWFTPRNLAWLPSLSSIYFHTNFTLKRNENVYIYDEKGNEIDKQNTGFLDSNFVRARIPDGQAWCIAPAATPDSSNNGQKCYSGYITPPIFSIKAGYYKKGQVLSLTAPAGCYITYTTNGNTPDTASKIYTGSIVLNKNTVVRAKCYDSNHVQLPSKMVTNTYFINETINVPVLSISTDSNNLWDYYTGIYVYGPNADSVNFPYFGSNFWQDWEKPAHIEYFKPSKFGNQLFELDANLSIQGNWSKGFPQRGFRVETRSFLDSSEIHYPIWSGRSYADIKGFNIRNAGIDFLNCHMRDDVMQRGVANTNIDIMETQACVLFLNGAYWGVYHIREKQDNDNVAAIKGADPDKVDICKWENTAQSGTAGNWDSLTNFIFYNNFTNQANYDSVKKWIDIENYMDYFIAETYYVNNDWLGDWTNNIRFWREQKSGKKWRYLFWDLDFGLGLNGSYTQDKLYNFRFPNSWNRHSVMFDSLYANKEFKHLFVNRYADLINTIFLPATLRKAANSIKDTIDNEMLREVKRWSNQIDLNSWNSNLNVMYDFINLRPPYARNYIQSNFKLAGQATLTLNASPAAGGKIKISTIIPDKLPWSGVYFNGNSVTVTAIPNPGYTFSHFKIGNTIDSSSSIDTNYTAATTITAYFTGTASPVKLAVSEINYNSPDTADAGNWIELHNYANYTLDISDWKLHTQGDYKNFKIPTKTKLASGAFLVLCEDTVKFDKLYPTVKNRIGNLDFSLDNSSDSISLFDALGKTILKFAFADTTPWPLLADGFGNTMEHISDSLPHSNPLSWMNGCVGGSPGKAYTPCNDPIIISEINYKSASFSDAGDWVELYNATSAPINISGWHFKDELDSDNYIIPTGTMIPAKGYLVLASNINKFSSIYPQVKNVLGSFNFGLRSEGEQLRLFDSNGVLSFRMFYDGKQPYWPYKPNGNGYTLELKDSANDYSSGASWMAGCLLGSPGESRKKCIYPVSISEVSYQMKPSLDLGDYIELHNYGGMPLQIGGWKVAVKNGTFTIPENTNIKKNGYLLITNNDSNFSTVPHASMAGFSLNDTADQIMIKDENGAVIKQAQYNQSGAYPLYTAGRGLTMELVADTAYGMLPQSWFGGCLQGSAGEAFFNCPSEIRVSEINYQSHIDYNSGNWIELYNTSAQSINLKDWKIASKGGSAVIANSQSIKPNEYIVLVKDSVLFKAIHPDVKPVFLNLPALNTTDDIELIQPDGKLHTFVSYIQGQSDTLSNGMGYTLEARNVAATAGAYAALSNWAHSCFLGSPGDSMGSCLEMATVTEINYFSDSLYNTGDWMELTNLYTKPIDLLNYHLTDGNTHYIHRQQTILKAGSRAIWCADTNTFHQHLNMAATHTGIDFANAGGQYALYNQNGMEALVNINPSSHPLSSGYGCTLERVNDTGIYMTGCLGGSPLNIYTPCEMNPVVSEINHTPGNWANDRQWIELWNHDQSKKIDLTGFSIGSQVGQRYTFPTGYSLAPNARLVLVNDSDNHFHAQYSYTNLYIDRTGISLPTNGLIRLWNKDKPVMVQSYQQAWGGSAAYTLELAVDTNFYLSNLSQASSWKQGCWAGSPGLNYKPCEIDLMISEINFHSSTNYQTGDWLELHHTLQAEKNIDQYKLRSSKGEQIFSDKLPANGYQIYAEDTSAFSALNPIKKSKLKYTLEDDDFLGIYTPEGRMIYYTSWKGKQQALANGQGYTLELKDSGYLDPSDTANYHSVCFAGSPGFWNMSPCTFVGLSDISNSGYIKVYPNPTDGIVYILLTEMNDKAPIQVLDITGRIVQQATLFNGQGKMDLGNLPNGLYILKVKTLQGDYIHRLELIR